MDKRIRDKKIKYGFNREAAIISASLSGKIQKYEHVASLTP